VLLIRSPDLPRLQCTFAYLNAQPRCAMPGWDSHDDETSWIWLDRDSIH
jgi:hypothetical protein